MSSQLPIISKRLYDLRTEHHLTQEKLAETLKTTTKTYREWEKKGSIPATDFLIALSDLYKVSTDYLLGRSDCKTIDENIKMINETTGLSEQAIENIKGIKKYANSNISLEILNTVLNDYESLVVFLEHLHDIKANQHLDSRAMLVKTKSEIALTLLDKTAPKKYGFSIKDIVRRDALDKINMIIDKWTLDTKDNQDEKTETNTIQKGYTETYSPAIPYQQETPVPTMFNITYEQKPIEKAKIPITYIESDKPKPKYRTLYIEEQPKKDGD